MINIIWGIFIVLGIIFYLLTGQFSNLNKEIFNSVKTSLDMVMSLFPIMTLWLGIMNIARVSGLLTKLSIKLSPMLSKIFPDIPKSHESLGLIATNIITNLFGLGNAATPFGLKAMKSLQTLNKNKDEASPSMITFLVLNTSGLTLIPTTIISLRILYKSNNPTEILLTCILATLISTISGLMMDRFLRKRYKHD